MGAWPAAVTAITLGVADVARARAFYSALGWQAFEVHDDIAFLRQSGHVLAVDARAGLALDMGRSDWPPGSGSLTLARNFPSALEVDTAFTRALSAGSTTVTAPTATDWGGHSGYLTDPDGHLWELAWNPHWPIGPGGAFAG